MSFLQFPTSKTDLCVYRIRFPLAHGTNILYTTWLLIHTNLFFLAHPVWSKKVYLLNLTIVMYKCNVCVCVYVFSYGKAIYFWSLVSALGTFWGGAGITLPKSIEQVINPLVELESVGETMSKSATPSPYIATLICTLISINVNLVKDGDFFTTRGVPAPLNIRKSPFNYSKQRGNFKTCLTILSACWADWRNSLAPKNFWFKKDMVYLFSVKFLNSISWIHTTMPLLQTDMTSS